MNHCIEINYDTAAVVEFDSSPWGFGALLIEKGEVTMYFYGYWTDEDAQALDEKIGISNGQTTWEFACLLLVLAAFATEHRKFGMIIHGDNLASLTLSLSRKGKHGLGRISRELSWRRVRYGWRYAVGHLPTERNTAADALSRLSAPKADRKQIPPEVATARRLAAPRLADLWTAGL